MKNLLIQIEDERRKPKNYRENDKDFKKSYQDYVIAKVFALKKLGLKTQ